jgi:lipid A disaccharide synthetase
LVQNDADAASLARALRSWLDDDAARGEVADRLREIRGLLVREDAAERAAALTLELLV